MNRFPVIPSIVASSPLSGSIPDVLPTTQNMYGRDKRLKAPPQQQTQRILFSWTGRAEYHNLSMLFLALLH